MLPAEIKRLIAETNPVFICNHSGGKDSQAMFLYLKSVIPADRLVVIHAHLPGVEWEGVIEHIQATIGKAEFHVVQAVKTFFEMVDRRQMWPSPETRQCTSDLKRGPIEKKVKELCRVKGFDTVVNCMGLRAQESTGRAKKEVFKQPEGKQVKGRAWYDWLPIHKMTAAGVFRYIRMSGQTPHWAYSKGMTRLSCCFCIMASKEDLQTAATLMPELAAQYIAKEKEINHTFVMPTKKKGKRFLDEIFKKDL